MSKSKPNLKIEEQMDQTWKDYSLDAPRVPNPISGDTQDLRRMCMIVHFVLPLTKIIFGAHYVKSCPTNDMLPTFVLVGGLLQLCFLIILVYRPLRQPAVLGVVGVTVLIWMLIASIRIFVEWKPDFFLGGWRYCNKVFFYFAFFVSVAEYIIITILILYVCTQFAYTKVDLSTSQVV